MFLLGERNVGAQWSVFGVFFCLALVSSPTYAYIFAVSSFKLSSVFAKFIVFLQFVFEEMR